MINFRKDDIAVNNRDPFENDKLDRKKQVENLTNLLNNVKGEFVLCVNGPWGSGKTTFIKMWQYYLEKKEYNTIYFNAWENDFAEDPLIPIINEFISNGKEDNLSKEKVIILSKKIFKVVAPATMKIATAGILDIDKINSVVTSESIKKVLSNVTNDFIDEKFKEHEKTKDVIKEFKEQLSEYVNKIVKKSEENTEPLESKLVFFIDELDRCKPTFAVNLLERLKHVFGIEEVVYVISIDKEQLGKTLSCIYGNGFNANGYLSRFFDLEYILPDKSNVYLEYLLNDINRINEFLPIINLYISLPIRESQKWTYKLELSLNMLNESDINDGGHFLLLGLLVIKQTNLSLYNKIVKSNYSDDEIIKITNELFSFEILNLIGQSISSHNIGLLSGTLLKVLLSDNRFESQKTKIVDRTNELNKGKELTHELEFLNANLDIMNSRNKLHIEKRLLNNIIDKIELSDNFIFE